MLIQTFLLCAPGLSADHTLDITFCLLVKRAVTGASSDKTVFCSLCDGNVTTDFII